MSNSDQQSNQGFKVAPSPFNAVKLELAIIVVAAVLLWAMVDFITKDDSAQLIILLLFGISSALWLVFRTRQLFRRATINASLKK